MRYRVPIFSVCLLLVSLGWKAGAEADLTGSVKSYWRVRVEGKSEIAWNEETLALNFNQAYGMKLSMLANGELSFLGVPGARTLGDLTYLEKIDPFRIRLNDLFVLISDFPYTGAYVRIGRQIRKWGTADAFNPTDNLNPYTLEDPLEFGESLGNEMIVFSLPVKNYFTFELDYIPYFRPAQLLKESLLALQDPSSNMPSAIRSKYEEFASFISLLKSVLTIEPARTKVKMPHRFLTNSQVGVKLSTFLLGMDLSVSYFCGREDIPYADNISTVVKFNKNGTITAIPFTTLKYPKVHVIGFDMSTSLAFLDGAGLWVEGAIFYPESYTSEFNVIADVTEVPTVGEILKSFVESTTSVELLKEQYWKLTAGMDYTSPWGTYMNLQFIHGFFDEVGGDAIKDYIFLVTEHSFFADKLKLRLTGGYCLSDRSSVIIPEFTVFMEDALEVRAGAYLVQGSKTSKFGQPAAGGDQIFLSAKYNF